MPPARPDRRRRALVVGASGHVGSAVVRQLLDEGWQVTAASRAAGARPNLDGLDVRRVAGDAAEPGQIAGWATGHELIVDAAAPYPLDAFPGGGRRPLALAEERTRLLLEAVAESGARLGFVSSFSTLGRRGGLAGLQGELFRRLHPYFEVKRRMEEMVVTAARGGLPAAIVNPTTCLGPWDGKPHGRSIVGQLLRGEVLAVAEHRINVIDVRDVAAGLLAAVAAERYAEPIPLAGHNLLVGELVDWICELAGVPAPRWRPPAATTVVPSYLAEGLLALVGARSPSPALVPILLCEQDWRPVGRAQRQLGAAPRSLSATLLDTVEWHRRLEHGRPERPPAVYGWS